MGSRRALSVLLALAAAVGLGGAWLGVDQQRDEAGAPAVPSSGSGSGSGSGSVSGSGSGSVSGSVSVSGSGSGSGSGSVSGSGSGSGAASASGSGSSGSAGAAWPAGLGVDTPLEDPSGHALDSFHRALGRAGRGEGFASVAVWGASHTACDHFTGRIRERLQARYGDGGRGFTFPAWPNPRSYWQSGVRVDRGEGWARLRLGRDRSVPDHYGVAGIVFDSAGRAATGRVRTGRWGVGAAASRFDVLTQAQPGGGVLEVLVDGERRATIDTAAPAVGALRHRIDVPEGPHGLELRARPGAPVRVYGVDVRRGHAGVVVHDLGLSGSRARYHLKWRDPVHTQQLTRLAPDLLVFAYGGNEGNDFAVPLRVFAGRFERALRRARRAAPEASCLVLGAFDKPLRRGGRWVHRHRTTGLAAVQRRIAARQGCAFFDTVAFMGGRLSMLRWVEADLAREDHVHLNARGYDRLGDVLVNALVPR